MGCTVSYLTAAADGFDRDVDPLAVRAGDAHALDAFRDGAELRWHANRCGRPDLAAAIETHLASPSWLVEHLPAIAAQLPPHPSHRYRTIPQPKGAPDDRT